jgi:hypothetical protein
MSIHDEAVVATKDGLVFNCDGSDRGNSSVKRVTDECSGDQDARTTSKGIETLVQVPLHRGKTQMIASRCFDNVDQAQLRIYNSQGLPKRVSRSRWWFGSPRY